MKFFKEALGTPSLTRSPYIIKFDDVFTYKTNKNTFDELESKIGPDDLYGGGILRIKDLTLYQYFTVYEDGVNVTYRYTFDALVDGDFTNFDDDDSAIYENHPEWIHFDTEDFAGEPYSITGYYDEYGDPISENDDCYSAYEQYYITSELNNLLWDNGYESITDVGDILMANVPPPDPVDEEDN